MIGRTYLERGEPVVVVTRWATGNRGVTGGYATNVWLHERPGRFVLPGRYRTAPRNVLIRRACGTLVVRPFRGLRRPSERECDG